MHFLLGSPEIGIWLVVCGKKSVLPKNALERHGQVTTTSQRPDLGNWILILVFSLGPQTWPFTWPQTGRVCEFSCFSPRFQYFPKGAKEKP